MIETENTLSAHAREEIDALLKRFPPEQKKSALLGALNIVQHENKGFLTKELMQAVADYLDLAEIEVYEVASFYSMYELKPVARHNVAVCTNISCMLMDRGRPHLSKKGRGMPGGLRRRSDDAGRSCLLRGSDARKGRRDPGRA